MRGGCSLWDGELGAKGDATAGGAGTQIARHIHSDEATGKGVSLSCGLPTGHLGASSSLPLQNFHKLFQPELAVLLMPSVSPQPGPLEQEAGVETS